MIYATVLTFFVILFVIFLYLFHGSIHFYLNVLFIFKLTFMSFRFCFNIFNKYEGNTKKINCLLLKIILINKGDAARNCLSVVFTCGYYSFVEFIY